MVTYVLGAGASLHAGYPLAGALGTDLHAWALASNFMYSNLIDEIHQKYGGLADFEQVLTELRERSAGSRAVEFGESHCGSIISAFNIAIPEFFYSIGQKQIPRVDLYNTLARDWISKGDVVLTFNYDLACERALRAEGIWEIGDGYGFSIEPEMTPPSKVPVLKLHGSINWLGMLFGGIAGGSVVSDGVYGPRPTLFGRRYFDYLGYPESVRDPNCRGIQTAGGDPALILPALRKSFFHQTFFGREWEPFWDYLWNQASWALEASQQIVIIGYSMPVADERARELLLQRSNPNAEILVFSGSRTESIRDEFRKAGFRTVTSFGEYRFEDFLNRYLTRQKAHNRELLRRQKCE